MFLHQLQKLTGMADLALSAGKKQFNDTWHFCSQSKRILYILKFSVPFIGVGRSVRVPGEIEVNQPQQNVSAALE